MLGINQENGKGGFKEIIDRLPVDASTLEGNMGDLKGSEPIGEVEQVLSHGPKGAGLLAGMGVGTGDKHTGDDRALVNIQATTARVDDIHHSSLTKGASEVRHAKAS